MLTYSALADFAPTPAHANFSYPRWRELAARTYDYGACSSYKEPKALLDSRHELQARASRGELAARTYDYGACSSYKEPKALLNSRYELQTRASRG